MHKNDNDYREFYNELTDDERDAITDYILLTGDTQMTLEKMQMIVDAGKIEEDSFEDLLSESEITFGKVW